MTSESLKSELKVTLTSTLRSNKNHKSAWFVRSLLCDLARLNDVLRLSDNAKLLAMINKYKVERSLTEDKKCGELYMSDSPTTGSEAALVNSYLAECYKMRRIPRNIPQAHIDSLIKPLARHESYTRVLHSVENKLMKGPPKAYLTYTMGGQSKIWFVRSDVNRKRRQSKELGRLIRYARSVSQKNLDVYRESEKILDWAWHEANWEHFLAHNRPLENSIQTIRKDFRRTGNISNLPSVYDWVTPVLKSMQQLNKSNIELQRRFKRDRDHLLASKTLDYFGSLSSKIYVSRLKRCVDLKADLAVTNPFTIENNLGALLRKYKLINPNY